MAAPKGEPTQILRFELAGENYAFDVLKTREVLTSVKTTPLPTALPYLSGVINLRGSVIPVVDLRLKFLLPQVEKTVDTAIVIVELMRGADTTVVGAVVDAVRAVVWCEASDVEPPPRFGMKIGTHLIQSIANKNGEFIVILDSDQVFSDEDFEQIKSSVSATAAS